MDLLPQHHQHLHHLHHQVLHVQVKHSAGAVGLQVVPDVVQTIHLNAGADAVVNTLPAILASGTVYQTQPLLYEQGLGSTLFKLDMRRLVDSPKGISVSEVAIGTFRLRGFCLGCGLYFYAFYFSLHS